MSPQERQVVTSNNFTFSFISSRVIVIVSVSLYRVWGCFLFSVGWRSKFVVSKYQESLTEQHLLSYCCIISSWRETLSSWDLSPGISPNCLLCSDLDLYGDFSLWNNFFSELYVKHQSCRTDPDLINKVSHFSINFYLNRKAIDKVAFATEFLCRADLHLNHKFEKIRIFLWQLFPGILTD